MRIRLANSTREFECRTDEPLLDAALAAGFNLAHSCRGGNCGACRALRLDGAVHYPHGAPLGLTSGEAAQGYELLCQARPRSDLLLDLQPVQQADEVQARRLPCRLERIELLAHDVMGAWLRLPPAEPLIFQPGQYLDVLLPAARRRSFSIASPPHDARLLELHVRRVPGGLLSEQLFGTLGAGALLEVEGPLGRFYYRDADRQRPLLLIGGGTGIAPLISMARHVVEQDLEREVRLYWGVRAERDLYALRTLQRLARRSPRFQHHIVLSDADAAWPGHTGWVHEIALDEVGAALIAQDFDVYAAGPPAMITALRGAVLARGLSPQRLYLDAFDYALDAPRPSSTAASRS